jgi:hypothetical protein
VVDKACQVLKEVNLPAHRQGMLTTKEFFKLKFMKTIFYASFITALFIVLCNNIGAQNIFPATGSAGIGTTTPNTSSALEIKSTTQGLLISRITKAQRDAIISPAEGLMIYQINNTPGFYYYTGIAWTAVTPKSKGWLLTGNSSTDPATNFVGTPDSVDFVVRTNNQERIRILSDGKVGIGINDPGFKLDVKGSINADSVYRIEGNTVLSVKGGFNLFVGAGSGFSNTTGGHNTANGYNTLHENTTGGDNTANGYNALYENTAGGANTATGSGTLESNTTGHSNTATGIGAPNWNTIGYQNTASGSSALHSNTKGNENTASGSNALWYNGTGSQNTASGAYALYYNTTGRENTASGYNALRNSTIGDQNTAAGYHALLSNYAGSQNTANGYYALVLNTYGNINTAIGYKAGYNVTTGSLNTFVGANANCGTTGTLSNSTAIGNGAMVTGSNIFVFGNSEVTGWGFGTEPGIRALKVGTTSSNGNGAYLTVGGTWTNASARSKKEDFQRQDRNLILEKINQLEVTKWKYKGTDREYHYGPMADDFLRLFKVGDDSSISDMDKTGVLFLGMQALIEKNKSLVAEQEKLKYENEAQKKINEAQREVNEELKHMIVVLQQNFNNCNACAQQSTGTDQQSTGKTITSLSGASLEQNIPNPFNRSTTINYALPQHRAPGGTAKIIVVDKAGKVLKEANVSDYGKGSVQVDASTLASGAYQYSLYVDGKKVDTKQMVLAK